MKSKYFYVYIFYHIICLMIIVFKIESYFYVAIKHHLFLYMKNIESDIFMAIITPCVKIFMQKFLIISISYNKLRVSEVKWSPLFVVIITLLLYQKFIKVLTYIWNNSKIMLFTLIEIHSLLNCGRPFRILHQWNFKNFSKIFMYDYCIMKLHIDLNVGF